MSASQALQPPALTWRIFMARLKTARMRASSASMSWPSARDSGKVALVSAILSPTGSAETRAFASRFVIELSFALSLSPSFVRAPMRKLPEKWIAPGVHALSHSPQKRQRPRSRVSSVADWRRLEFFAPAGADDGSVAVGSRSAIASVGQRSTHSPHASHRALSSTGSPRYRPGSTGSRSGNAFVLYP